MAEEGVGRGAAGGLLDAHPLRAEIPLTKCLITVIPRRDTGNG